MAKTSTGINNEFLVNHLVDLLNYSVYTDAAHSMAAVGMLAPTTESLLSDIFKGIKNYKNEYGKEVISERRSCNENQFWDCHFFFDKRGYNKNLVKGIFQLAESIKLLQYLPEKMEISLQVLFEYRNRMFHYGFEWPDNILEEFTKRIKDLKWPQNWFTKAQKNNKPWIYYLSEDFIEHYFNIIEETLIGIGKYCKKELLDSE